MTKNEANGIWVFAEQKNGVLDKTPHLLHTVQTRLLLPKMKI